MVIILGQILCVGKHFTGHKRQCDTVKAPSFPSGQRDSGKIIQNCISENLDMALWLLLVLVLLFTERFRELCEVKAMTFKLLVISQCFLLPLLLRHKRWWNFTMNAVTNWLGVFEDGDSDWLRNSLQLLTYLQAGSGSSFPFGVNCHKT